MIRMCYSAKFLSYDAQNMLLITSVTTFFVKYLLILLQTIIWQKTKKIKRTER